MDQAAPVKPSAQALFAEQLPLTAWDAAETGPEMIAALDAALNGVHEQLRTQFPGDLPKLNACDALFKQAHAGLALTAAALIPADSTELMPAETSADQPLPHRRTPHVLHTAVLAALLALFLLCAVLLRFTTAYGTVDIPVRFFTDSMLALLALTVLWEVLFRIGRLRAVLEEDGVGGLVYWLGKGVHWSWLTGLGLRLRKKYRDRLPEWQFAPAQVIVKPAVPDRERLLESCRTLLRIIDSNLPLFAAPHQAVEKADYSPLLRALIQESYTNQQGMSPELQAMLGDQLQANGWTLLDYSPEREHLFTTQPMAETFTIFPAILDRQQQLIETGFACVKEE